MSRIQSHDIYFPLFWLWNGNEIAADAVLETSH
jgi:hypothetical protein